jgi:hypothetical protein
VSVTMRASTQPNTALAGLRPMPEGMLRVTDLGGWGSGRGI